jgi:hypothetical protein
MSKAKKHKKSNNNITAEMVDQIPLRPLGEITDDLEILLCEMTDSHKMQFHEIMYLVYSYLEVHCQHAKEIYVEDGSSPIFYYGPKTSK